MEQVAEAIVLDTPILIRDITVEGGIKNIREEDHEAFNYITFMAVQLNKDISDVSIGTFMESERVIADKNMINAMLFSLPTVDDKPMGAEASGLLTVGDEWERFNTTRCKKLGTSVPNLLSKISNASGMITDYEEIITAELTKIEEWNFQMKVALQITDEAVSDPLFEEIKKILASKNWQILSVGTNEIFFATTECCMQRLVNPAANININLNMGLVGAKLGINHKGAYTLRGFNVHRNLFVGGYYHPHVSSSGNICWGDVKYTVAEKLAKGELADVMDTYHTLLNVYEVSNPYVSLHTFNTLANKSFKVARKSNRDFKTELKHVPTNSPPELVVNPPDYAINVPIKTNDIVRIRGMFDSDGPSEFLNCYARVHRIRPLRASGSFDNQAGMEDSAAGVIYSLGNIIRINDAGKMSRMSTSNYSYSRDEIELVTPETDPKCKFLHDRHNLLASVGMPFVGMPVMIRKYPDRKSAESTIVYVIDTMGYTDMYEKSDEDVKNYGRYLDDTWEVRVSGGKEFHSSHRFDSAIWSIYVQNLSFFEDFATNMKEHSMQDGGAVNVIDPKKIKGEPLHGPEIKYITDEELATRIAEGAIS